MYLVAILFHVFAHASLSAHDLQWCMKLLLPFRVGYIVSLQGIECARLACSEGVMGSHKFPVTSPAVPHTTGGGFMGAIKSLLWLAAKHIVSLTG